MTLSPRSSLPLIFVLVLAFILGSSAAEGQESAVPQAGQGENRLLWVEISVGGQPVRVKAGGVAAIHPDAPFRVVRASTDAWLDLGLDYRLVGEPGVDLKKFHTLAEILGDRIYEVENLSVEIIKANRIIGGIGLVVRLMPIDWLRRAENVKDQDEKIRAIRKVLELTPDDELAARRLVDLLVEDGRLRQAAKELEARSGRKDDPEAMARLAGLYLKLDDKKKAALVQSRLLVLDPDNQSLLTSQIALYESMSDWNKAAPLLERLAAKQEGSAKAETLLRLAQARRRSGQTKGYLEALDQAVKLQSGDHLLWRELAMARQETGDAKGALEAWRESARLAPQDKKTRLLLAEGYMKAGDRAASAREVERAALLDPDDLALWLRLATVQQELENTEGLILAYQNLARLKPDDPDVNYNLGVLLSEGGKAKEAAEYLERAAKAMPQDAEAAQLLFENLVKAKDWDRAAGKAEDWLKIAPDKTAAMRLVYDRMARDRPDQVAFLLDGILKTGPKTPWYYEARAALAMQKEQPEKAREVLTQAMEAMPGQAAPAARLAALLEAEGKDEEALALYGKVLDLNPDYPGAQESYLGLKTAIMARTAPTPTPAPPPPPKPVPAPKVTPSPRSAVQPADPGPPPGPIVKNGITETAVTGERTTAAPPAQGQAKPAAPSAKSVPLAPAPSAPAPAAPAPLAPPQAAPAALVPAAVAPAPLAPAQLGAPAKAPLPLAPAGKPGGAKPSAGPARAGAPEAEEAQGQGQTAGQTTGQAPDQVPPGGADEEAPPETPETSAPAGTPAPPAPPGVPAKPSATPPPAAGVAR